jgi:hypothetical protein
MGQPVAVVEKPSSRPGMVRFEANRNLTGMGHERFASADEAIGPRPAAEIARRLFATGKVQHVHAYLNMVTVDLAKGFTADGLAEILENLYIYYRPGVLPPTDEELMASIEAPVSDTSGTTTDASAGVTDTTSSRVPAALLERSRLARERWASKSLDG